MLSKVRGSRKLSAFSDSIFPEMTRLAQRYDAVNLSQGFPDFPAPAVLKQAACDAILADVNQYSISFGAQPLRDALAAQFARRHGVAVDPEQDITICCGSTEAMLATMLACVDPGDEVIVFEPFYENYGPGAILAGATPKYVQLSPPDWTFDPEQLASAFSDPRHRHQHADQPHR
jgi:aspartate/methionine/tyrosine aminotransferase